MDTINRVLIVDDDEVGRRALSICLASFGYESTEASDAIEALTRLHTGAYALVIKDHRMPGLNGMELLHIVKKKWNIPILLISGELRERSTSPGYAMPTYYASQSIATHSFPWSNGPSSEDAPPIDKQPYHIDQSTS